MADTRQVVGWALERKCAFRSGEQWFLPARTCTQLADLRTVAFAEGDGRVVSGICVTSAGRLVFGHRVCLHQQRPATTAGRRRITRR
jgi:hypothetical protein